MPREGRARGTRAEGERKSAEGERKSAEGERKSAAGERRVSAGADPRSLFARGTALVSVVGADGKAVDREVKVGVMNRVSAEIVSGLEPGEKVVIGSKAPAAAAQAPTGSALVPAGVRGGGRP